MKKPRYTILIEGAGTATSISVMKGITNQSDHRCRIVTVDMDEFVSGKYFSDVFYTTVSSADPDYLPRVVDICRKEKVDVYIPIVDYGFLTLSRQRSLFEDSGIYLMLAAAGSIEICQDKFLTYGFMKKIDVPTPRTLSPHEGFDSESLHFPLIVKPRVGGRASIDVHTVRNSRELAFFVHENENCIIQDHIDGDEFTADCLNSLDGTEFIEAVIRKRVLTKGGLSVKAELVRENIYDRIRNYVSLLGTALKLPGAYNVQGFYTAVGDIFFTEVNPRFAGTHAFTIQAGLNSIKYLLDMLSGQSREDIMQKIHINRRIKMVRYWNEIFVDRERSWTWNRLLKR